MRLLLIHSDFIEYEAKKKTGMAEETTLLSDRAEDALAVFCAVEAVDEDDLEGVVEQALAEIGLVADKLSVETIVVYPYAHLSSDLSRPDAAIWSLKALEEGLKVDGLCGEAGTLRLVQILHALLQGPPSLRTLKDHSSFRRGCEEGEERGHPRVLRDDS